MRFQWTPRRLIPMLGSVATVCAVSGVALAGDSSCKTVFDAMLRVATTPHHSFTTLSMGEKSIVSESINDGKRIYVLINGKWTVSRMTPQNVLDQEKENIQNKKASCSVVRDESVDGVSATLYSTREEGDGDVTTGQVWISKATGLPVRIKTDTPADTRYVFSGISAPNL